MADPDDGNDLEQRSELRAALQALGDQKDVDGITPASLGRLTAGLPGFRCATPLGMMKLLDHYGIDCAGKHAVVIGRSNILGKPAALMLLEKNATVTVAHSRTVDLPSLVKQADILVAAVGRPEMVKGDWIKPGAAVVDFGTNYKGDQVFGDVAQAEAAEVAGLLTPVPGGTGPVTNAMLAANVLQAARWAVEKQLTG